MQISDTTDLKGIYEDIDFICGTDSTSYPLKDKARNVNRHYYKAVIDALKSSGRSQFDDPNLGSLPNDTFNLSNNIHEYKLLGTNGNLADFLRLNAVEVKDSAGNWTRLKEIDINDLSFSITDYEGTSGIPRYYDVIGNYLYLYPAPDTTQVTATDGLKVWYQREIDLFEYGDTSPEPAIPEPFQRILSIGGAIDWLMVNDSTKVDRWRGEYEQLRAELREFYSNRNTDISIRLTPIQSRNQVE